MKSTKSHRFFQSQFWKEKIWEKYPAKECLLGGEILKSEYDGLVATGVPSFVIANIRMGKLEESFGSEMGNVREEVLYLRNSIEDLKRIVKTEK